MKNEKMMTVKLSSCGNPDLRQNPNDSLSPEASIEVATLKGASEICLKYIANWNLGGGNWAGGQVHEDGKQVARVSYNGRVWDMDDEEIKQEITITPQQRLQLKSQLAERTKIRHRKEDQRRQHIYK
ncbi:hypothetical protein ES703_74348 [subsurface metagenome]